MLGNLCQRRSVPADNTSPKKTHDSEEVTLSRRASGKTKEVRFDDEDDAVNQKDIFMVPLEMDNRGTKRRHKSGMDDGVASPKFRRSDSYGESKRTVWSSSTEFMLTCVGYCVGLGNIWRFPYLCYKNGGGAFIIPYTIMMVIIGAPLLFMEYSIGQYFGIGSLSIFKKICPLLQGIGIGHTVLNVLVCTYYNLIISLALYYMYASLAYSLPWSNCDNLWNTHHCYAGYAKDKQETYANVSTAPLPTTQGQTTTSHSSAMVVHTSPTEEYFRLAVLQETDDIDIQNLGSVQWHLCLTSFLSWFCITMFVCRGIKSTGKVAYFTAIFPYIMLTILVVRGSLLTGAYKGIVYFITPKWSKLLNPDVWFQAATQLFYSTSLAWGGMITMASYNTFHHDCYRDAIIINIISFFTSMYAGVAVFAVIGHMAEVQGLSVEKVIQSGPGLAFIVYPGALSKMPLAPVWTILFFFMIFLLGVGSQMVLIETVVTGFVDEFPRFGLNPKIRFLTTAALCSLFFVAGIPMTTQGGMYVLQLMDHYSAGFSVLIIAIFECAAVNWFYGNKRISENVKDMLGRPVHKFWKICWLIISPCAIFCVAVFSLAQYRSVEYRGISYPLWADVIGWILCLASVVPIFLAAIYVLCRSQGQTIRKKFLTSIQPPNENDDDISSGMSRIAASLRLGSPATQGQTPSVPGSPQTKGDFLQSNSTPIWEAGKGQVQCHQGHHCQVHHNRHHQYLRIRRESLLNELTFGVPGRDDDDKNDEYVGDDEHDDDDDDNGVDMDKAKEKADKDDKNNDIVDECNIIA